MKEQLSQANILELQKDFIYLALFLPWDYKFPTDDDYFSELIANVHFNVENQPYAGSVHFAIIAMHMIFMGIVYNYIALLRVASPREFDNVLIGFHDRIGDGKKEFSWHNLAYIQERTIFEFFRYVRISKSDIAKFKTLVDRRNGLSHTNGVYVGNLQEFSLRASEYLKSAQVIDKACFLEVKKLYFRFLESIETPIADEEEAAQYIRTYFAREYNVGATAVENLLEIELKDYPKIKDRKKFHAGLKKYTEEWNPNMDLV